MKKTIARFAVMACVFCLCMVLTTTAALAAPPVSLTADQVAGTYTSDAGDTLVLLANGTMTVNEAAASTFSAQMQPDPGGNVSYVVTPGASDEPDLTALGLPWYGGAYYLDLSNGTYRVKGDVLGAIITDKSAFSYVNLQNPASKTGYTTTITVADDGYENVYVFGMWCPKEYPEDVYDINAYSDEVLDVTEWENGMYYYGQSAIKAVKNEAGDWQVSVDLASSMMNIVAFHDVASETDVDRLMIQESLYYVVEVPWDSEKQSESYDLTMAFANRTQPGTVEYSIPWSTTDGVSIPLSIYTPYGYDPADTSTLYPVLYMIPGAGTTERTFFDNCLANNIFDNYIEQGVVGGTIVVTMDGQYAADYLTSEIVPYIETNYHVISEPEARVLFGVSMGGVSASNIYLDEEQSALYGKYCLLSGWASDEFGVSVYEDYDDDYLDTLRKADVFIGAGGKDDFNMFGGQGLSTNLINAKAWFEHYDIDVDCSVVPGNHHWETWVPMTIEFVGKYLSDPAWGPRTAASAEPSGSSEVSAFGERAYTYTVSGLMGDEKLEIVLRNDGSAQFSLPEHAQIKDVYVGTYEREGDTVSIQGLRNIDDTSPYAIPGLWAFISAATGDATVVVDDAAGVFVPAAAEAQNGSDESGSGESSASPSGEPSSSDGELQTMIDEVVDLFFEDEYVDEETGLTVTCNVFVPEDAGGEALPAVFFITDSSTVGRGAEASLTQGWGGLIWATAEEQAKHPCVVIVPTFNEVILDDHNGFITTSYIDLIPRLVTTMAERYGCDMDRLYATGQSMGCMTFLITAANNPELFAAELFVDGQWDITTLQGLESQKFFYLAAGGDDKAVGGQNDVMAMFDADDVKYAFSDGWDAQASAEELIELTQSVLAENCNLNLVRWETGTVLNGGSGMEHMASFDYAYKLEAVRDWLFDQTR